jgi:hypothetical protein
MAGIREIFQNAPQERIQDRLYYNIRAHRFNELKELAKDDPALLKALEASFECQSGPCYLVPVDLIQQIEQ